MKKRSNLSFKPSEQVRHGIEMVGQTMNITDAEVIRQCCIFALANIANGLFVPKPAAYLRSDGKKVWETRKRNGKKENIGDIDHEPVPGTYR